jgi:hypothetical protein
MTHPGLLMRTYNAQTANTPWYTELGFTQNLLKTVGYGYSLVTVRLQLIARITV